MQTPRKKPTQQEFETIFGSSNMSWLATIVYPIYFWWMEPEFRKAKTPQDLALIHSTPRAIRFWFVCGLVLGAPVVLVIMFMLLNASG